MNPPPGPDWATHVGSRIVLRIRDGAGLRDILGELVAVDGQTLRVQSRRGPVTVPLNLVVAGKPVPPKASRAAPPHRALSVADLELTMAKHWQADEQDWLGGWLLRASGGFTKRANSVLAIGEPGMPMDVAVVEVTDWYTERGLHPVAAAPEPRLGDDDTAALLAAASAFTAAGWRPVPDNSTAVLTAPNAELRNRPLPDGLTITLADEPDPAWIGQYEYRGQAVPEHGIRLLRSAPRQVFASVRTPDGAIAGMARGSQAEGWTGLTAMKVEPAWRRRGLALALIAAIAEWGWAHRSMSMYLQVVESNTGALATYARAGFTFHHRYGYLSPP